MPGMAPPLLVTLARAANNLPPHRHRLGLVAALSECCGLRAAEFEPRNLVVMLYKLARMRPQRHDAFAAATQLLHQRPALLEALDPRSMRQLVWAFAEVDYRDDGLAGTLQV